MRTLLFLFICFFTTFSTAGPPTQAKIPFFLSGTWENIEKNEQGMLAVLVTSQNNEHFGDVIAVTGSHSCKDPINFTGTILGERIIIESRTENVCGRNGKFSIEAVRERELVYIGTFSYRWMGGVWASGTFRIISKKSQP